MLKKITLAAIFAVVSIVSFGTSSASAAKPGANTLPSVSSPVMKGYCHAMGGYC